MKQVMILSIVLLAAVALVAPAHAGVTWGSGVVTLGTGGATAKPPALYGLSSNVHLDYAVLNANQDYELGSCHMSGNRVFGTTNNTTLIFYGSKATGETAPSSPAMPGAGASSFGSGWTAL